MFMLYRNEDIIDNYHYENRYICLFAGYAFLRMS